MFLTKKSQAMEISKPIPVKWQKKALFSTSLKQKAYTDTVWDFILQIEGKYFFFIPHT